MRQARITSGDVQALGAVGLAQAIDARWIDAWPLTWTPRGLAGIRDCHWPDRLDFDAPGELALPILDPREYAAQERRALRLAIERA